MKRTARGLLILALLFGLFVSQTGTISAVKPHDQLRATQNLSAAWNYSTDYTLTGDGPTDMVAIALAQLGKRGVDFGYSTEWCTNFIGDCAILAGQSSAIPLTLYFETLEEYIFAAGGYEVSKEEVKPGDLCLYKNFAYFSNHIDLVYAVDGTTISTIGGNSPRGGSSATTGVYLYNTVAVQESATDIYKILRPNYVTIENPSTNVFSNQSAYNYGSEVALTWASVENADSYRIDISCDESTVISQNLGIANAYRFTPTKTGNYCVYITTIRGEEEMRSAPCTFTVAYEAPVIKLKANNQDVTVTWSDVGVDSYFVSVYNSDTGEVLYAKDQGKVFSWERSYDAGNYTFCVTAMYPNGVGMEATYDFSIHRYTATTNKGSNATFSTGEKVILRVDGKEAKYVTYTIYYTPEAGTRKQIGGISKYNDPFTYTYAPTEPGIYECRIRVYSSYGYTDSEPVTWYVAEEREEPLREDSWKMGHTLNLESDISINLAVSKALLWGFDMETVYILAEVETYTGNTPTETRNIKLLPVEQGDYYYFTLTGLTAVNMNDRIRSVLYGTKDGQSYYSPTDDYSIADYVYSQMGKASMPMSLKTLCADLLRYGSAIQVYKGYRTDCLADRDMTEEQKAYLSDIDTVTFGAVNEEGTELQAPTVIWKGKSLDLRSKVGIKYIVDLTDYEGDLNALSLTLFYVDRTGEERNEKVEEIEVYKEDEKLYAFSYYGLLAAELRTPVTVQVMAGKTPVSNTLRYSPDTYGNGKTEQLLEVCKVLFAYSDSALTYFS